MTEAELRAFLNLPATRVRAAGVVGKQVREQDVMDLVGAAFEDALRTPSRPRVGKMQPWFDRVCKSRVAKHYARKVARAQYEGRMPVAPEIKDEAGLPVADPGDAVVDIDPSFDPERDDFRAEGLLFTRWMERAVAQRPRDRETFALMMEWAEDDEATYRSIAEKHGMTEAALTARVFKLKKEYAERYRTWRNGMFVWLWRGAALALLALAVALALGWLRRPRPQPEIAPDPAFAPSAPAPTVLPPPPPTFEPAAPTGPDGGSDDKGGDKGDKGGKGRLK